MGQPTTYALEVHLLGTFEVFLEGVRLQDKLWQSRQVRSLLKVLAARRGQVTTSEQLVELLWPEDDPQTALRRLYVRLSQLRTLLKGQSGFSPIQSVPGGYLFGGGRFKLAEANQDETFFWVDVDAFETASDQGERFLEARQLPQAVESLETARQLYRGDFLAEDAYAEWTIAERERLHERHLVVLTELAEAYAQQGFFRRAINLCQLVLSLDPWREAVFLRLMLYYYYAGDKGKALQTYTQCVQALSLHLGIDPDPRTQWLADRIQEGTLWSQTGEAAYPPPAYEGRLFEVPYSLGESPFTGRDRELAWMLESWQVQPAGCLLISGEAGIGKTRLADAFLFSIKTKGSLVMKISVHHAPGNLYEALLEAFNLSSAGSVLGDLSKESRNALLQWVKPGDEMPWGASRVDSSIPAALIELIQKKYPKLLIYIDDAHNLDLASIELINHLMGEVGLLLTSRTGEVPPEHPFLMLMKNKEAQIQSLVLNAWRLEDVQQLLNNLGGENVVSLASDLFTHSQGNPLFVIASLQHCFEEGILYVTPNGRWAQSGLFNGVLAPSIEEAIAQRLNLVQPEDRMILDIMAVAGGALDYEVLQSVLACDESLLLASADRLISKSLILEPRGYQSSDICLTHGLYGEVLYETLPKARRRIFHRRIAEAMLATGRNADSQASILADHFFKGGDLKTASQYACIAGDHTLRHYAPEQAWGYYQAALDWVADLSPDDNAGFFSRIWLGMAETQRYLGDYGQAAQLYQQAIPHLTKEHKEGAIFQLFNVKILQGEPISVFADLSENLEQFLLEQGESWSLALLYWSKSFVALIHGDVSGTRFQYAAGWRVARKLAANGQTMPGWIYQRAISIIMRAHNQWGNYASSLYFANKILAIPSSSGVLPNTRAVVNASMGESYFHLGDYDLAETAYENCYQLADQAQDPRLAAVGLLGLGGIHLERGHLQQAREYAQRVLEMSAPPADLLRQLLAQFLIVRVAIKTGVQTEHQASLENLVEFAQGIQAQPYVAIGQVALADLLLSVGAPVRAEASAGEALAIAERCCLRREICAAKRYLALAKAQQGELADGISLAEEALAMALAIQAPYEAGLCWLTLARVNQRMDTRIEAAQMALALFTKIGAEHAAEQTRSLLTELGVETESTETHG
jgi:DNA-binding SARP family transcriptional activator